MVVPLKRLDEPDWIHKKSFKDKFKNRKYQLFNFEFEHKRSCSNTTTSKSSAPRFTFHIHQSKSLHCSLPGK